MPSSPSTPSTQQAPIDPFQPCDFGKYRQTVYYDGAGRHIADSRRRSKKVRQVEPAMNAHLDWVLYPTNNATTSLYQHSGDSSPRHPSSAPSSGEPDLAAHVTGAKHRSSKPKVVVIVEARQSTGTRMDKAAPSLQRPTDLTPPPTPRLGRLATPDLSDLDETPFCDCGVEAHVIKFCTSCNRELNPRSL